MRVFWAWLAITLVVFGLAGAVAYRVDREERIVRLDEALRREQCDYCEQALRACRKAR